MSDMQVHVHNSSYQETFDNFDNYADKKTKKLNTHETTSI